MTSIPDLSHPLVAQAYELATQAHFAQTRRDGRTPYLRHIDAVMSRTPNDPILLAVAALHDSDEADCVNRLSDERLREEGIPSIVIEGRRLLTRGVESYPDHIVFIKEGHGGRFVPVKVADNLANLADQPTKMQIRRYASSLLVLTDDASFH